MSRTYDIACLTCKETLWIGQVGAARDPDKDGYIYTGVPKEMAKLQRFLFKHRTVDPDNPHKLVFGEDQLLDTSQYHDFESEPGECVCDRCLDVEEEPL